MAPSKVRPPMKKLFIVLPAVVLLTLVTLVLVLSANMFVDRCPQPVAQPAPAIPVNGQASARRLGQAIQLQTISSEPAQPADRMTAFLQLHDFLRASFPRVPEALSREIVDRYSLLYTWAGVSNEQKPILLAAHLDVVPVESGTEGRWSHPAFSGHIADGYVWGRGSRCSGCSKPSNSFSRKGSGRAAPSTSVRAREDGAAKIAARLASRGVKLEYVLDEGMSIMRGAIPGVNESVAFIGIAEKGLMTVELAATGTGGHASMPPPKTPVGLISTAIHEIEAHPMPAAITPPVEQLFVCANPHMGDGSMRPPRPQGVKMRAKCA